jgi:hypothetical protein
MLRHVALPVRVEIRLVGFGARDVIGAENGFAGCHAFAELIV